MKTPKWIKDWKKRPNKIIHQKYGDTATGLFESQKGLPYTEEYFDLIEFRNYIGAQGQDEEAYEPKGWLYNDGWGDEKVFTRHYEEGKNEKDNQGRRYFLYYTMVAELFSCVESGSAEDCEMFRALQEDAVPELTSPEAQEKGRVAYGNSLPCTYYTAAEIIWLFGNNGLYLQSKEDLLAAHGCYLLITEHLLSLTTKEEIGTDEILRSRSLALVHEWENRLCRKVADSLRETEALIRMYVAGAYRGDKESEREPLSYIGVRNLLCDLYQLGRVPEWAASTPEKENRAS